MCLRVCVCAPVIPYCRCTTPRKASECKRAEDTSDQKVSTVDVCGACADDKHGEPNAEKVHRRIGVLHVVDVLIRFTHQNTQPGLLPVPTRTRLELFQSPPWGGPDSLTRVARIMSK
jgi:hypothetical protein